MSRQGKEQELQKLIEPVIEAQGYELVKLSYAARRQGLLQLIIDSEQGIGLSDCEQVSRAVSKLLDEKDPIEHTYRLEVSSPGEQRPLTKLEHFGRFTGEKVKIETSEAVGGAQKFAGTLLAAGKNLVTIKTEAGSTVELPFKLIKKANLWYIKP